MPTTLVVDDNRDSADEPPELTPKNRRMGALLSLDKTVHLMHLSRF